MKPKILVSRKISDLAEEKLQKEFDATLNLKDEPIPEKELIKIVPKGPTNFTNSINSL